MLKYVEINALHPGHGKYVDTDDNDDLMVSIAVFCA
jgi:hypothetical protein